MADIVNLRKVLRTGILDKKLDTLRAAAGNGSPTEQIAFLKVIYGQTANTYNTYAGTMLTQLSTLSYLEAIKGQPESVLGIRKLDSTQPLEKQFTVLSQDNLLARRLLLSRVTVPDMKGVASADAFISFSAQKQAEEAERDKKEILRLQGELELFKANVKAELDKNASGIDKNIGDLADTIARLSELVKPLKTTISRNVADGKGVDNDSTVPESVPEPPKNEDESVLDQSIRLVDNKAAEDTIDWK